MSCLNGQIRENSRRICEPAFGLENALARIVRRRWPVATIDNVAAEWGLTEGRARGVVYAQGSLKTINSILRHKRGGWSIALEMLASVTGEGIDQFLQSEIRGLERDAVSKRERALKLVTLECAFKYRVVGSVVSRVDAQLHRVAAGDSEEHRNSDAPLGG